MRATTEQFSFASGELSPRLHGRTDLQKYASGAELIENFILFRILDSMYFVTISGKHFTNLFDLRDGLL